MIFNKKKVVLFPDELCRIMKDIEVRADIIRLIDTFYEKIKVNPLLGPIFIEVVLLNFEQHLPILYDFWCTVLLGEQSYHRNAMEAHLALAKKTPMTKGHFDEWLLIFTATVDELYQGEKADEIKYRAQSIAGLMLHKINMD